MSDTINARKTPDVLAADQLSALVSTPGDWHALVVAIAGAVATAPPTAGASSTPTAVVGGGADVPIASNAGRKAMSIWFSSPAAGLTLDIQDAGGNSIIMLTTGQMWEPPPGVQPTGELLLHCIGVGAGTAYVTEWQ